MTSAEIQTAPTPSLEQLVSTSRVFNAHRYDFVNLIERQEAERLVNEHPEAAKTLIDANVDALHGSTSYGLASVLEHGIVRNATIRQLGLTVIGYEHASQPNKREKLHVVPWSRAGETIRYAEHRAYANTYNEYVRPDNADEIAARDLETYQRLTHLAAGVHQVGLIQEARWLKDNREQFADIALYPVVYGVDSSRIAANTAITAAESAVEGDVEIAGNIPTDAIRVLYVPEACMPEAAATVANRQRPDITVQSLESLRTLDQDRYGHLLR